MSHVLRAPRRRATSSAARLRPQIQVWVRVPKGKLAFWVRPLPGFGSTGDGWNVGDDVGALPGFG